MNELRWWEGLGKELEEDIEATEPNIELIYSNSTYKIGPKYVQDGKP